MRVEITRGPVRYAPELEQLTIPKEMVGRAGFEPAKA
jgi:hypothetical protein